MGRPSIYPTGVTIYEKEKTYNGYTLIDTMYGATLIDMNGRVRKIWHGLETPIIPAEKGHILCAKGKTRGQIGIASHIYAGKVNWDGKAVWSFQNNKECVDENGNKIMSAELHHDMDMNKNGNYLLLTHNIVNDIRVSDKSIIDERLLEVSEEGEIVWEWKACDHIDEMGLDEAMRKMIFSAPPRGDWIHFNTVKYLGENHFFDEGDTRFDPENIICSSRQLSAVFIIEKHTGKIVWRIGPDYLASPEMKRIGQVIGQHCVYMIPKGIPGEGNILLFDNGGFGGYGTPNGCSPDGVNTIRRHYSRVLEINPATLEKVWEYSAVDINGEYVNVLNAADFFSAYISSAQRLPNGNTLINQGADGLVIEVTPDKKTVWEFVNPILNNNAPKRMRSSIYRAYRVPYEWAEKLEVLEEISIEPIDNTVFRVPGSAETSDPLEYITEVEF